MKRSTMLWIIKSELNDKGACMMGDPNQGVTDELADHILQYIEELGMAPPEVAESVKTSVMIATPMGWQEQGVEESKLFVRKWEEE